jgi:predicted dehydrogenase
MPFHIGLIGYGKLAEQVHVNLLTTRRDAALVGIADIDPARRAQASRRVPAAKVFSDYAELLALRDLDAVVISLPTGLHAQASLAALEAHKHIYLEKPLAANLLDARAILDAWRQAQVVGTIGFNYRFNPLFASAKQFIASGKLGRVLHARTVFSTHARNISDWRKSRASGGGALLEMASQHVDLIRFLFGQEIVEVFARTWSVKFEEDSATLEIRLGNDARVQSYFSLSGAEEDRVEIYGERGKLSVDRYLSLDVEFSALDAGFARVRNGWRALRSLAHAPYILQKLRSPWHEPSYRAAVAHFIAAARGEDCASPDLGDGYASLRVVIAAEESARSRRVETIPDG